MSEPSNLRITPPRGEPMVTASTRMATERWGDWLEGVAERANARLTELETPRPMGVRVSRTTIQAIPPDTVTAVIWTNTDLLDLDQGDFWSAGTPTRLMLPSAQWYTTVASVHWSPQTVGTREMALRVNGGPGYLGVTRILGETVETDQVLVALGYFQLGAYVELMIQHSANASLNITAHWTVALTQGRVQ